jgi:hypothetical protein
MRHIAQYSHVFCEAFHNLLEITALLNLTEIIMGREFNSVNVLEVVEIEQKIEIIGLDDLSLMFVGGGELVVSL